MPDREYELKFGVDSQDILRLLAHPALAQPLWSHRDSCQLSTYFDTPDGKLKERGISLRCRKAARGATQTLKQADFSSVDRHEWEARASGERPDPEWLRETPLARVFQDHHVVDALLPRFVVEVARTTILIAYRGAEIECALDQGEIRAGTASMPLLEFEIELKRGPRGAILALARDLAGALPLVLNLSSKAERGHRLAEGTVGKPRKPMVPGIGKRLDASFEGLLQTGLHALLGNAVLIAGRDSIEAVHNTRIALRRLRGLLALFKPALRRKRLARLGNDLRWLSHALGRARDADVFQSEVFDPASRSGMVPGAAALAEIMRGEQTRAHEQLQAVLASRRYRLLLLDVLAFSSEGVRREARGERARRFVMRRLEKHRRTLAHEAKSLRRLPGDAMHQVRKKAKTLRYNLDLLREGRKGRLSKPMSRLQHDLQQLQELLGKLHDSDAMRHHLRQTIMTRRGDEERSTPWHEAAFAAGFLTGRPIRAGKTARHAATATRRVRRAEVR